MRDDSTVILSSLLQVLGVRKIPRSSVTNWDRYRLLLSDGLNSFSSAVLCTDLNHLVEENILEIYSVIQLKKYQGTWDNLFRPVRKFLIVQELTIIYRGSVVNAKLGDPIPYRLAAPSSTQSK